MRMRAAAPDRRPPEAQGAVRRALPALAIALVSVAAYLPALSAGFVWDDHSLVENSPLLRGSLGKIWFSAAAKDYWPLTWTSLWIEWRIWGENASGYHATNVALHAATAVLLWRVLRAMTVPGAWLAAALFAVHPVGVESVAWISERKNTLSGALFLASVLAWLRFEERGTRGDRARSVGLFGAALLAKSSVVALPLLVLGRRAWRGRRLGRRDLLDTAPLFALALAAGVATIWFQHHNALLGEAAPARGPLERLGGAGWALAKYLETAFVPVRIGAVYPEWPVEAGSALYFAPVALLGGIAAALWRLRSAAWARPVAAALGYHALMVLPVLGFLDMAYFAVGPVSNHLQYLALIGPVALVASACARWCTRVGRPGWAAAAAAVLALGAFTAHRASAFERDRTLWQAAVREMPGSAVARSQLAAALADENRLREAVAELEAVARLSREPASRERALAYAAMYAGRHPEAVRHARELLRLSQYGDARRDGALVLMAGGLVPEAVEVLADLVRRAPASSDYSYWLGAALVRQGRADEAIAVLRRWCTERPGHPKLEQALAFLLVRDGRLDEARARAAAVAGVDPGDERAAARLATWMAQPGWQRAR